MSFAVRLRTSVWLALDGAGGPLARRSRLPRSRWSGYNLPLLGRSHDGCPFHRFSSAEQQGDIVVQTAIRTVMSCNAELAKALEFPRKPLQLCSFLGKSHSQP